MININLYKGLKRNVVTLYTGDIEELPIKRFIKFNKFLLIDAHLGNQFSDIDNVHLSTLYKVKKDSKKLITAVGNLRAMIYNIYNDISPEHLSFSTMVHSINGEEIKDLSDENLMQTRDRLSELGLTQKVLKKKLKRLKMNCLMS